MNPMLRGNIKEEKCEVCGEKTEPWVMKKTAAMIVSGMIKNEEKVRLMTNLELARALTDTIWAKTAIDSYEAALLVGAITRLMQKGVKNDQTGKTGRANPQG